MKTYPLLTVGFATLGGGIVVDVRPDGTKTIRWFATALIWHWEGTLKRGDS